MNLIVTKANDSLLDYFSETLNILDSNIRDIKIYLDGTHLIIDIYLCLLYPKGTNLKLNFQGVKEYSFYWNKNHIFYYVESFKLFKTNNLFYISFDPDGEEDVISPNDQDFILCENIEGLFLEER
jgi:hypothetical protein